MWSNDCLIFAATKKRQHIGIWMMVWNMNHLMYFSGAPLTNSSSFNFCTLSLEYLFAKIFYHYWVTPYVGLSINKYSKNIYILKQQSRRGIMIIRGIFSKFRPQFSEIMRSNVEGILEWSGYTCSCNRYFSFHEFVTSLFCIERLATGISPLNLFEQLGMRST